MRLSVIAFFGSNRSTLNAPAPTALRLNEQFATGSAPLGHAALYAVGDGIMPASDDNPQHAFNAYRDDFPAVPPSPYDQVTASWAYELPNHIVDGDLVVPPGKVFAMGDNRTESLDGRFWGFVPRENIVGRPMFVYWSFETPADQINKQSIGERIGFMGHILFHIFDETRWKRTFHLIK